LKEPSNRRLPFIVRYRAAQIVGVPSQVRHDERRLRVFPEQAIAFGVDLLEGREAIPRIPAIGIERELEPALVLIVDRLKELLRVGRVDQHGHVETCRGVPDGIELRIVEREP